MCHFSCKNENSKGFQEWDFHEDSAQEITCFVCLLSGRFWVAEKSLASDLLWNHTYQPLVTHVLKIWELIQEIEKVDFLKPDL